MSQAKTVPAGQYPQPLNTLAVPGGSLLVVNRGTVNVYLGTDATLSTDSASAALPPLASMVLDSVRNWWVLADPSAGTTAQPVEVVPSGLAYGAGAVEIASALQSSGVLVVDSPQLLASGTATLTSGAPTSFVTGGVPINIARYSTILVQVSPTNNVSNADNTVIAQILFYSDNTSGVDLGYTIADTRTGLIYLGLETPARASYMALLLAWTQRAGTAPNHTVTAGWSVVGSLRTSERTRVDRREPTLLVSKLTNQAVTAGTPLSFTLDTYGGPVNLLMQSTSALGGNWTVTGEAEYYAAGTPSTNTIFQAPAFAMNAGVLNTQVFFPRKSVRLMLNPGTTGTVTSMSIAAIADPAYMQ